MALKLYIHWEQPGFPEKTSKIQIPKSWSAKTVKEVIGLFAMPYNNHNKDTPIEIDTVHLETTEGVKIYSNDIVGDVLEDRFDYHIKFGAHLKANIEKEAAAVDENLVRCKNYGCNQLFNEEHNHDEACQHHTGPPIFHDTMKCWSCCRERKAFDFESFQLITGCAKGRHSTVVQKVAIAASPNAPTEGGASTPAPVQLKSIADFNTLNPDAASAATGAVKIIAGARKSTRSADGCSAKCQRRGCQKEFQVAENAATACTFHTGT